MRANTKAILAHPTFRAFRAEGDNGQWSYIKFPSMRALLGFVNDHAATSNEAGWQQGEWAGLAKQSIQDFYSTGKSPEALRLFHSAEARLPAILSKHGEIRSAVTGGYWDTPSVIAGLPLAARMRKRTKLTPLNLRIAYVLSAGISAESLAPITAKITHAIHEYILAGGVANLTVIDVGSFASSVSPNQTKGFAIETVVNTSDMAELSIALHPAFSRLLGGPMQTALCVPNDHTSIGVPRTNPIKDAYWIGGPMREVIENAEKVLQALKITD